MNINNNLYALINRYILFHINELFTYYYCLETTTYTS